MSVIGTRGRYNGGMGEWTYETTRGAGETAQVRVEGASRDELYKAANATLDGYFGTAGYRIIQFDAEAEVDQHNGQVRCRWQANVTATTT